MAYTITQQPSVYTPAYNDNIFVVTSTNSASTNFKYIAKVYVGTDIITLKQFPDVTYGNTYFNVGKIIEQLVTQDIDKTTTGFQKNLKSYSTYYIKFYEEYDIAGVLTVSALKATSNTIRIFNGEIDWLEYQNYDQQFYLVDYSKSALNHNLRRSIQLGQDSWIHWMCEAVTKVLKVELRTYDINGTLNGRFTITNPYQTNANIDEHFMRFPSGTHNLLTISSGSWTVISGATPVIDSDVKSYAITLVPTDGEKYTTYFFDIVEADCIHETIRLHYLNNLGAFESFNFTKASKRTETIKRDKYKAVVGTLTSSGYSYNASDINEKVFSTVIKDKYSIQSDWISQEYQNVLEQLVTSPVVYWDNDGYGLVSVNVTTDSFEWKKNKTTKMIQLQLEFEVGFDRYRQRY